MLPVDIPERRCHEVSEPTASISASSIHKHNSFTMQYTHKSDKLSRNRTKSKNPEIGPRQKKTKIALSQKNQKKIEKKKRTEAIMFIY